jgi:imidazolonepropionase-like amidohydrolase
MCLNPSISAVLPIVLAVAASACASGTGAGGSGLEAATAIVDVTVVPMDAERLLPHQTVVTRGDRIVAVGPTAAVEVPAGAQSIEGTGLFLLPGLTDAHVHLRDDSELLAYLAHGVTTVVHLSGPTGNVPDVVELRDRIARGAVLGPTIYASGRMLDGDPAIFENVSTVVRAPEEAARTIDEQLRSGVDVIKVYNNLPTDALKAVTRAAHDRGLTVWGHVPRRDGRREALQQALAAGLDVIAHGEEVFFTMFYGDVESQLDRGVAPAIADALVRESVRRIRADGAAVIPNLSFVSMTRAQLDDLQQVWADPETRFLHPAVLSMWKAQNATTRRDLPRFDLREHGKQQVVRRLTDLLHEAGVPLFVGTDASASGMFPGRSAHLELQELVAAGLTPFEALAAGTRVPGEFLSRRIRGSQPFGTVTVGSRADLLLVGGNPLADVANTAAIVGVVVRGTWYSRSQIEARRTAAVAGFVQ